MKKIGLIILIAIVALGAMGAGYAAWQQTLNITGTAKVATFDVSMTWDNTKAVTLPGNVSYDGGLNSTVGLGQPTDSDNTTFTVDTDMTGIVGGYNTSGNAGLIATISNAVPGTYVIPGVVVHNASTIPVGVTVSTTTTDSTEGKLNASSWVSIGAGLTTTDPLAASGGTTTAANITITIPDYATQDGTYSFIIPVTVVQS